MLPFPYFANQHAPALELAGANVDGVRLEPYPTLTASDQRY